MEKVAILTSSLLNAGTSTCKNSFLAAKISVTKFHSLGGKCRGTSQEQKGFAFALNQKHGIKKMVLIIYVSNLDKDVKTCAHTHRYRWAVSEKFLIETLWNVSQLRFKLCQSA